MRVSRRTIPAAACAAVVLIALAIAYAGTLAPGITWANNGSDSGDLVTAAATLGIAHPTGYPTYLLLARGFQLIPIGDLAFRSTLLSAAAALLAVLLVYGIILALLEDLSWRAAVAAGAAALALGVSQVFWSQAVVAEVYSLNALFIAAMLLFALQATRGPARSRWAGPAQGLVAGLALGNHITAGLVVAAWLGAVVLHSPAPERIRAALTRALGIAIGLLVYLYLPIRAAAHPPINWGNPTDWAGVQWVISGAPYRGFAFGLPANLLYGRVSAWAALLLQQFGLPGLALGCYRLVDGAPRDRAFLWLTAGVALVSSAFAIAYNTSDSYAYLIPTYLIFAIWIGLALARLLGLVARWRPALAPVAAVVAIALLTWPAPATANAVDASRDRRAIEYATSVLASAPPRALVITASDLDTFPLWYYHYALGERPDIVVLVEPLLEFAWYRENLRAVYPALQVPVRPAGTWLAEIITLNGRPGQVCRARTEQAPPLACS